MSILIITVGKLKESYLKKAQADYLSDIKKVYDIDIIEVIDEPIAEKMSDKQIEKVKEREGQRILSRIPYNCRVVLLDDKGEENSFLHVMKSAQRQCLVFVIGASNGFGENVYRRIKKKLSFSKMTFPHQLARIVLLEQISKCV